MKKIIFLSMLFFSILSIAQEKYKVVVMPKKFDFLREENQYNLNTLSKLFFEKEGFQVIYEEDLLSQEFYNKRCDFLYFNINDVKSLLTIRVTVDLKDCEKQVVLESKETRTKEKDFNLGYNEAVRAALIDLRGKLDIPIKIKASDVISTKYEIKAESIKFNEDVKPTKTETISSSNNILVAQSTKNGYDLVDAQKNIIFELLKTSNPSVFNAKKGDIQGVFTLNGTKAKFESYQNDVLVVEEVEVKF